MDDYRTVLVQIRGNLSSMQSSSQEEVIRRRKRRSYKMLTV